MRILVTIILLVGAIWGGAWLQSGGLDPLQNPESRFLAAVDSGDIRAVRAGLDRGVAVTFIDASGHDAVFHAAVYGRDEILPILLDAGAPADRDYGEGFTALLMAANFENVTIVDQLLRHGARVNAATARGATPLMAAVNRGSPEVVCRLLAAGADPWLCDCEGRNAVDLTQADPDAREIARLLADACTVVSKGAGPKRGRSR